MKQKLTTWTRFRYEADRHIHKSVSVLYLMYAMSRRCTSWHDLPGLAMPLGFIEKMNSSQRVGASCLFGTIENK